MRGGGWTLARHGPYLVIGHNFASRSASHPRAQILHTAERRGEGENYRDDTAPPPPPPPARPMPEWSGYLARAGRTATGRTARTRGRRKRATEKSEMVAADSRSGVSLLGGPSLLLGL